MIMLNTSSSQRPDGSRAFIDQRLVLSFIGFSLFFGLWIAISGSHLIPKQFLPGPVSVVAELTKLMHSPFAGSLLIGHVLASLQKFGIGFAVAALIGIPLGLMLGMSNTADRVISPL